MSLADIWRNSHYLQTWLNLGNNFSQTQLSLKKKKKKKKTHSVLTFTFCKFLHELQPVSCHVCFPSQFETLLTNITGSFTTLIICRAIHYLLNGLHLQERHTAEFLGHFEGFAFRCLGDIHALGPLCHVARTAVAFRPAPNSKLTWWRWWRRQWRWWGWW